MTYFHPAWLEHQRQRYLRADAYRFAPPGTPEAKMPGWLDPSATRVRLKEAQEAKAPRQAEAAQEEFERELLELRLEVKKLKLDHELWLLEEKYSPNQPRVPAGNPEGGQWTSGGGVPQGVPGNSSDGQVLSDENPDPIKPGDRLANVIPICMLGSKSISTDRFGNQSWWADYVCADGFTFRKVGFGGRIRPFLPDPR